MQYMTRSLLVSIVLVGLLAALAAGVARAAPSTTVASAEAQAKAVATRFMRTLNAKRFEEVCHMMSARFYRENDVPDEARCVLGLRVGFMGTDEVRFKIVGAHVDNGRAVVRALADGAPGQIVLVQERGVFKVLSLRGA
jgi:hypothetical protein